MKLFFGGGESHCSSLTGGISHRHHETWQRDRRAMKNDRHLGCIAPTPTPSFIQSSYWSVDAVSLGKVTVGIWGMILQENAFPTAPLGMTSTQRPCPASSSEAQGVSPASTLISKDARSRKALSDPLLKDEETEWGTKRAGDWHAVTQKIWSRDQVECGFPAAVTWTSALILCHWNFLYSGDSGFPSSEVEKRKMQGKMQGNGDQGQLAKREIYISLSPELRSTNWP